MGRGIVRLDTTKNCPVHDTCSGFTHEYRNEEEKWGKLWCPIHETKDCPTVTT